MSDDKDYEGPNEIGHFKWPGRGTTYSFKISGHDFQIYVTEKRKKVRIFVDREEWAEA